MANIMKNTAASQVTPKLYLNEKFADVHFILFDDADNIHKIPANKIVLAALSPVFDTMFFGSLKEGKEVEIIDTNAAAFKEFLQFFYLSEVKLSMEHIESVARLADKYDIVEHFSACAKFLKSQLNTSNMCWGYHLALFFDDEELIAFCVGQIRRTPKDIFASDTFRQCTLQTLEHILGLDLTCNEVDIFRACLLWAKNACKQINLDENQMKNLKNQLGDCLKLIRFGEMMIEDLTEIISSNKELFTPEELQDICFLMSMKGYKPKIFIQKPRNYIWNVSAVLKCQRTLESDMVVIPTTKSFQSPEKVSFTSNQPVLLGQFSTQPLFGNKKVPAVNQYQRIHPGFQSNIPLDMFGFHSSIDDSCVGGNVEVTINEIGNHFESTNVRKLFHSKSCSQWIGKQLQVDLPEPIFIKPHTIYEIRLVVIGISTSGQYNSPFKAIQEFQGGLKIRFHQNDDRSSNDWVETFCFNKL